METSRLDVKIKESQPVSYARLGYHSLATGRKFSPRQVMANPPPPPGIESGDNHMPIRSKNPVDLAKDRVGIVCSFEYVRKEYGIYRIRDYREVFWRTHKVDSGTTLSRYYCVALRSSTAAEQVGGPPGTDLEKLIAEYIVENRSNLPGLLAQQGGSSAGLEPVRTHAAILAHARRELYNGSVAVHTAWSHPWDFLPANGY